MKRESGVNPEQYPLLCFPSLEDIVYCTLATGFNREGAINGISQKTCYDYTKIYIRGGRMIYQNTILSIKI